MDLQRSGTLVDWTAALIGIYWGVWWGFLVESIITYAGSGLVCIAGFNVPSPLVIATITFLACFHAYSFVQWLWRIHVLDPDDDTGRTWINELSRVTIISLEMIAIAYCAYRFLGAQELQFWHGLALTIAWPVFTVLTILYPPAKGEEWLA